MLTQRGLCVARQEFLLQQGILIAYGVVTNQHASFNLREMRKVRPCRAHSNPKALLQKVLHAVTVFPHEARGLF